MALSEAWNLSHFSWWPPSPSSKRWAQLLSRGAADSSSPAKISPWGKYAPTLFLRTPAMTPTLTPLNCPHPHLLLHQMLSCSPVCQKFLFTLNTPFPLPLSSFPTHWVLVKAEVLMKQYWQHNLQCWFTFSFRFQVDVSCGLVTQSCLTLSNPMDCSPPGSSVHGLLQARIMEFPSPKRKASLTGNQTRAMAVLQPKSTESYPLDHQGESMYFIGDSILVKVALFCSFQWSHSTPLYKYISIYLINPLLGDGK